MVPTECEAFRREFEELLKKPDDFKPGEELLKHFDRCAGCGMWVDSVPALLVWGQQFFDDLRRILKEDEEREPSVGDDMS